MIFEIFIRQASEIRPREPRVYALLILTHRPPTNPSPMKNLWVLQIYNDVLFRILLENNLLKFFFADFDDYPNGSNENR